MAEFTLDGWKLILLQHRLFFQPPSSWFCFGWESWSSFDLPPRAQNQTSPGFLTVGEQKFLPLAGTVVLNHSAVSAFSRETTTQRSLGASCAHIFWHEICASTACLPPLTTSVCMRSPIPRLVSACERSIWGITAGSKEEEIKKREATSLFCFPLLLWPH